MKKNKLLIIISIAMFIALLAGCSASGEDLDPIEAIRDAYGNREYSITFNNDDLEAPIESLSYTAYRIPALPTPERVGYIFGGWYFDKKLTAPYSDGMLYLYMTNVTLYPKWTEEALVHNGIYSIEFEARILPETIVKGELTDKYGGYIDFCDDIIASETYIEKVGEQRRLKLQFDTDITVPYGAPAIYTVSVSPRMGGSVRIADSVLPDSNPIKNLFLDITDIDLGDSVYLDIYAINYEAEDLDDATRRETRTRYTVKFNITRFIGFAASFANPDVELADGYYLVKTHYRQYNNKSTMLEPYNPVYSYLYADGGNYRLIKPFMPYAGFVGTFDPVNAPLGSFTSRGMTYAPLMTFYDIDLPGELKGAESKDGVTADYWPEYYNAGNYGGFAVEFHADQGRFYYIFDLGEDFKSERMVMGGVTGFMEMAGGMGYYNSIMTIEYNSMIRLTKTDYTPLEGDAFTFANKSQYYPGGASDLNKVNNSYNAVKNGGLSTMMANVFYSGDTLYSSRYTVTPTAAAASRTVADSRYRIAEFDIDAYVYGYDATAADKKTLKMNCITVNSLGSWIDAGKALVENLDVVPGQSVKPNQRVWIENLYKEEVASGADYSAVTARAYKIVGGAADYGSPVVLQQSILWDDAFVAANPEGVAIVFKSEHTYAAANGSVKIYTDASVVELTSYREPYITVSGYDPDAIYTEGTLVDYPTVSYSWMGAVGGSHGIYYPIGDAPPYSVDPTKVAYFLIDGAGNYNLHFAISWAMSGESVLTQFEMAASRAVTVFEMRNRYGERYLLEYEFAAEQANDTVYIVNGEGETLDSGKVTYNASGIRNTVGSYVNIAAEMEPQDIDAVLRPYYLNLPDGSVYEMPVYSFSLYTENGRVIPSSSETASIALKDALTAAFSNDYFYLSVRYQSVYGDYITRLYRNGILLNGSEEFAPFAQETLFTDYEYRFAVPEAYTASGLKFRNTAAPQIQVQYYNGAKQGSVPNSMATYESDGVGCGIVFHQAGEYQITFRLYAEYDTRGNRIGYVNYTYEQTVTVVDYGTTISITYVTDEGHQFLGGGTERTYEYNLFNPITTIRASEFQATNDVLYAWGARAGYKVSDYSVMTRSGRAISDFVTRYGAVNVTLYAVWDTGIDVTVVVDCKDRPDIDGLSYTERFMANDNGGYTISVSAFDFSYALPEGYVIAGYTGGPNGSTIGYWPGSVTEACTLKAVFRIRYRAYFSVDSNMSDNRFYSALVTDGYSLANTNAFMNVNCKADGYEFVGWYVQGDETQTVVNLATYIVTEATTFVAKFEPIGR